MRWEIVWRSKERGHSCPLSQRRMGCQPGLIPEASFAEYFVAYLISKVRNTTKYSMVTFFKPRKGVRLKEGGMKIFKGQRPDTYQPGLPSPGLVHLYFQGLKARHIKILFEKGFYECVGPSALLIEENAALGLAAQAGMCRAFGAGGIE